MPKGKTIKLTLFPAVFVLFCAFNAFALKASFLTVLTLNSPIFLFALLFYQRSLKQTEKSHAEAAETLRAAQQVAASRLKTVEALDATLDARDQLSRCAGLQEQVSETATPAPKVSFARRHSDEQPATCDSADFRFNADVQREIVAFREIAQTIGRSLNLEDTCTLIASKLGAILSFDTCVIHLIDDVDGNAYPAHVTGSDAEFFSHRRIQLDEGVIGEVIANDRAIQSVSPKLDLADDPARLKEGLCSLISAPLLRDERAFGSITLYTTNQTVSSNERLRLLETVAPFAANAISNSLASLKTQENALSDPLTGLPNARAAHLLLEQRLAECQRQEDALLSILSIDIDDFERVNRVHGYGIGDRLISDISQVIKSQLRQMDTLARYEGDEFVAIMPTASLEAALLVADRIRAAVESFSFPLRANQSTQVRISIGLAGFPAQGETADQLLTAARHEMARDNFARQAAAQTSHNHRVVSLDSYR